MVRLMILFFLFPVISLAGAVPSGAPAVSYGQSINASPSGSPGFTTTGDAEYTASCGFGLSNATAGNHYRCYKQGGTGGTDWSVSSTKVAYCRGFYVHTNASGTSGLSFGYGTAAATNNSASNPTGDVPYNATGNGFNWYQPTVAGPIWVSMPVYFSGTAAGATIYPYLLSQTSTQTLQVDLICVDK